MKLKILILLLLTSVIAKAQTTYQLNYDNVRVGKDANSTTSFRGSLRFPYIGLGSITDSVLTITGGLIKKVPRSQFASSSTVWGNIGGILTNQTDLIAKFNNYYLNTNPSGYISGITALMVTNALGFTPYDATNPSNFITSGALTPYLLSSIAASTYQPIGSYLTSESDPIWAAASGNYRTKTQNDALYYPLSGNPSGFITSYTETDPLFNTKFSAKSTTDLAEGANQYFTNTRARNAISLTTAGTGAASYNSTTGVLNVPTPVTGPSPDTTVYRTVSNSFTKAQTNTQISNAIAAYTPASQVDNDLSASTTRAPSKTAVNTALGLKADKSTTLSNGYGINAIGDLSANRSVSVDTTKIAYKVDGKIPASQLPDNNLSTAQFEDIGSGVIGIKTSYLNTISVPIARNIIAGNGLTGGGVLSADITLKGDTSILATKANTKTLAQLQTTFNTKQATLVSGTNIKTINGNTLLGSGDLVISGGGGGSGTVTSVSVTTANGVSGSVATATTTPAITLSLGNITPTSIATIVKPATIFQTPISSNPTTDSLVVKDAATGKLATTSGTFTASSDFSGTGSTGSPFTLNTVSVAKGGTGATANTGTGVNVLGTAPSIGGLNLTAGTATAGTAPLKFNSGTNTTTAVAGQMEYNGTILTFTPTGTTRQTFGYLGLAQTWSATQTFTAPVVGTATAKTSNTVAASTAFVGKQFTATGSGTGAATTISFAHGVTGITGTSSVIVTPNNAAAAGISYVTVDATNVNVIYTVAPASGTNNLAYSVSIK